jgi:hypothetical protein
LKPLPLFFLAAFKAETITSEARGATGSYPAFML